MCCCHEPTVQHTLESYNVMFSYAVCLGVCLCRTKEKNWDNWAKTQLKYLNRKRNFSLFLVFRSLPPTHTLTSIPERKITIENSVFFFADETDEFVFKFDDTVSMGRLQKKESGLIRFITVAATETGRDQESLFFSISILINIKLS